MTRDIYYANQLLSSLGLLETQKRSMVELSQVVQAILGNGITGSANETLPLYFGFGVTPHSPTNLTVNVAGGCLFSWQVIDATAYGQLPTQLPADSNDISKFAYNFTTTPLTFVPPGTGGFSRNDVVTVSFLEVDDTNENIPFFAGFSTSNGFAPPTYTVLPTLRSDKVVITVTAGTAATTGTQVTPSVPAGTVGVAVVTTTQGQTQIISGNITPYNNNQGLISETLTQKRSGAASVASVSNSTTQSLPISTRTVIAFPTTNFDTGNYLTNAAPNTFNPKVAGYYKINCYVKYTVTGSAGDANGPIVITLQKNGADLSEIDQEFYQATSVGGVGNTSLVGSTIVNANGTTDYFNLITEQIVSGLTLVIDAISYFQIEYMGNG